ncbi:hypothetical protein FOG18_01580 [Legionella israelensis]|nr:hypothetical protein FOG18_01580 [Legionella israelensis]
MIYALEFSFYFLHKECSVMRRLVFSVFATLALSSVQADELTSFPQVANAVAKGKSIHFVFHLNQCTADYTLPRNVVSVKPNAVLLMGNSKITASDRHFTMDEPAYKGVPIYSYAKMNLDAEGHGSLRVDIMHAENYALITSHMFQCPFGKGMKIYS